MLKNILNLEGAQQLSNNEQKEINGGLPVECTRNYSCDYSIRVRSVCESNGGFFNSICRCCEF